MTVSFARYFRRGAGSGKYEVRPPPDKNLSHDYGRWRTT